MDGVRARGGLGLVQYEGTDGYAEAVDFWAEVEPHWPVMHYVAQRLLPAEDAQDALQDALSVAWQRRASFDPARASLKTWLVQLTIDQARKSRRRVARQPVLHLGADDSTQEYVPNLPAPSAAKHEERMDVERAVAGLSHRQRLAVQLYYFVDLSTSEVAGVMGCAEGTVKSTLADARRMLARQLGADY